MITQVDLFTPVPRVTTGEVHRRHSVVVQVNGTIHHLPVKVNLFGRLTFSDNVRAMNINLATNAIILNKNVFGNINFKYLN